MMIQKLLVKENNKVEFDVDPGSIYTVSSTRKEQKKEAFKPILTNLHHFLFHSGSALILLGLEKIPDTLQISRPRHLKL